jgi:hypothetical protein
MEPVFPVHQIENNIEIMAKIVQAVATKYDCSVRIFYQDGRMQTVFDGEDIYKPQIITEVLDIIC